MGKDGSNVSPAGEKGKVAADIFPGIMDKYDRRGLKGKGSRLYWLLSIVLLFVVWQLAAEHYNSNLLLPHPWTTMKALFVSLQDREILVNMLITLRRVGIGFAYASLIGIPLGFLMGYSKVALRIIDPIVSSLRQVPIMSWIPLTIVWLGLGDGPTIFLIAMAGVFPIMLNTITGVMNISEDYYNAAKSMGAGQLSIIAHVVLPGALPDILSGMRLAISAGWMSVI